MVAVFVCAEEGGQVRLSCAHFFFSLFHTTLQVGPNGIGKTTLLSLFSGEQEPLEGWVRDCLCDSLSPCIVPPVCNCSARLSNLP